MRMRTGQGFVDDYMIVVENDQDGWLHHVAIAEQEDKDVFALADRLRDEFELFVSQLLDTTDPTHNDYRVNILREMLLGWGSMPYENLARDILARMDEGK